MESDISTLATKWVNNPIFSLPIIHQGKALQYSMLTNSQNEVTQLI